MQKRIFIISCLILVIIGLVATIHSSYFTVQDIKVTGIHQITEEEILTIVGNLKGQNIFLIPGREVVDKLYSSTRIQGAKLERKLPHTVELIINERSGVGLFKDSTNKWNEISNDGMILQVYAADELPQLPYVEGIIVNPDDGQVEMTAELTRLLKLINNVTSISTRITKISYSSEDIQLIFDCNTIIHFGQTVNTQKRIAILTSLFDDPNFELENVEYIDLRYERNPVIRLLNTKKR